MKTHRISFVLVALAATLTVGPAVAGGQEEAAAEVLFQQGKKLMEQGKFVDACAKLAESQKLDPAVGTLLYLGECYEKNGQLASAWATFQAAAAAGRKANQAQRIKIATERANLLLPRMPRITISVPPLVRVSGLEVSRDGIPVGEASWGEAVPVDTGEHIIVAKAPGKKSWTRTIQVSRATQEAVEIPRLEDAASSPVPAPVPTTIPTAPATPPPPVTETQPSTPPAVSSSGSAPSDKGTSAGQTQRTMAYVAGGVGIVGLAIGTIFGVRAINKEKDSEAFCTPPDYVKCTQPGVTLIDEGKSAAHVSVAGFVVGGLGLVGGAVVFLTAPSARTTGINMPRSLAFTPWVGPRTSGLALRADF
jgi:hypothetical protein